MKWIYIITTVIFFSCNNKYERIQRISSGLDIISMKREIESNWHNRKDQIAYSTDKETYNKIYLFSYLGKGNKQNIDYLLGHPSYIKEYDKRSLLIYKVFIPDSTMIRMEIMYETHSTLTMPVQVKKQNVSNWNLDEFISKTYKYWKKEKKKNKYYTTSAYYDSLPTYDFLSSIDSANVVFLFGTPTSIQITTDNTILIYDVLIKSKKQDHRQLVFTIRRKINKLYRVDYDYTSQQ